MSLIQRSFQHGNMLFREAPRWRTLLFAALASTALTVVSAWLSAGPGRISTGGYYSPPPPLDPASEARLNAYEAEYESDLKLTEEGRRCEAIAGSFGKLSAADISAGKNVRLSTAARMRSINSGQHCQDALRESDKRFQVVEGVAAAGNRDGDDGMSPKDVVSAIEGINDFDRSRARYDSEKDMLAQANKVLAAYQASAARIAALVNAVNAMQFDQSAKAALAAADAKRAIIDFDQKHMTQVEEDAFAKADQASQRIGESRARLDQLSSALDAAAAGRDPASEEQFVTLVASLSDFDEALADNDQKPMIARARSRASSSVWTLLSQRLAALQRQKSEADYKAVAGLIPLLPSDGQALTPDQARMRREAGRAKDYLAASDARLHSLAGAASAWKERGRDARGDVLTAHDAINSFDQSRFNDEETQQFQTLTGAQSILLGSKLGLRDSENGRTYIFIFSPVNTELNREVVESLIQSLRDARFLITDKRDEAALVVKVSIRSVTEPQMDEESGPVAAFLSDAELQVSAQWVGDDTMLIPGSIIKGKGTGSFNEAKQHALLNAIGSITTEFNRRKVNAP